jgi:RNA polymerase sporulation-specific sigma factor
LQAREDLTKEKSEEPTVEEIAKRLGEKKESVVHALEAIVEPISLYEPVFTEGGDSIYVLDQISDTSSSDEIWLENIVLRQAIHRLSERERKIIYMRYYLNKTQMEIAAEIGISQAQVSRLEKAALKQMKAEM